MLSLRADLAEVYSSGLDWLRFVMFPYVCFLENKEESIFPPSGTTLSEAHPTPHPYF